MYWRLSSQRSAAMLHNGRLIARTLARQLGQSAVRQYRHGAFAALVPPRFLGASEAVAEAGELVETLANDGFPVRHAGSFGFDFVAVEGFFDTAVERNLLRVAAADCDASASGCRRGRPFTAVLCTQAFPSGAAARKRHFVAEAGGDKPRP